MNKVLRNQQPCPSKDLEKLLSPVFELITIDFVAYFKRKVSYKSAPKVLIGLLSAFFFLIFYIFILGLFKNPSYLPPDFNLFIGIYFKELLLPQVVILGAWYISTQKANKGRLREYKFLVSLPLNGKQIFTKFFITDLIRYFWIPTAFAFLYFGLLPIASFRFLARPILFAYVFYIFIHSLIIYSHLLIATKPKTSKSFNYIIKFNPIIIVFSCIFFEVGQLFSLFAAKDLSPIHFALTNLVTFTLSIFLVWRAGGLFLKLYESNFWYKSWGVEKGKITEPRSIKIFSNWINSNVKNPFLFKNLVLFFRSNSKLINGGITFVFFGVAYLLAMNNITHEDILSVLLAFTVIYILLYNVVVLNRLNQNEESLKILFSFPTTKSGLYFSLFIPISSWLITVVSLLTFWLGLKGVAVSYLFSFWLKSYFAIIVALVISLNCGLGNYPDVKVTKNRYFMWLFMINRK